MKPLVLIVRDGWGVCDESPENARRQGNATLLAHLPVLDRLFREYRDHVQISMELASVETIKKFVGAGLGISLISRTYCQPDVAAGVLKLIPLDGQKLYRELGLIYRRDRYLSLPPKVFINVVRESTQVSNSAPPLTTSSIS